jgi:DNA-binding CsgD family transcriptional regulator
MVVKPELPQVRPHPDLFGREDELALLRGVLDPAADGRALPLTGEPGVGKSMLLQAAEHLAADRGRRVLKATGSQFEAEISFSGLHQLLFPLLENLAALPPWERQALEAALGLAAGSRASELAVCNAALALLVGTAQQAPLGLFIDDVPWMDHASASVLAFIARRLTGHRIAFIAASRTSGASYFEKAGLEALEVRPLDATAAAALIASRYPALTPRVRQRLVREAEGNPLALLELPAALETHLMPVGPSDVLPLGRKLERLFGERIESLPEATREVLLVAVLDGTGDLHMVERIAAKWGEQDALAPAMRAGLVSIDPGSNRLTMRHPLIRSTVVEKSTMSQRRRVHLLLAHHRQHDIERNTWHLAQAAEAPDETVAAMLHRVARQHLWRGDSVGAIHELVRAAELSPDQADRARRLAEAAYLGETVTGDIKDVRSLLDAAARADPRHRGGLAGAVAEAYLLLNERGDIDRAHRRLAGAIEAVDNPTDAHDKLLIEALTSLLLVCHYGGRAELWEPFEIALARLRPQPPTRLALAARAWADPARIDRNVSSRLGDVMTHLDHETSPARIIRTAMSSMYLDGLPDAREALWRAVQHGREGGAVTSAIKALLLLCDDSLMSGAWDEVDRLGDEASVLSADHGYLLLAQRALYYPAMVSAARGDRERVSTLANQILAWAVPRRVVALQRLAHHVNSVAASGQGDFATAYTEAAAVCPAGHLEPYNPHALRVIYDLVDAAVRVGRHAEAAAHVGAARAAGVADLSPRLGMTVGAAEALVSTQIRQQAAFEQALATPGAARFPFERARIQMAYGELLRRRGSRIQGREQLRAARQTFAWLDASPWVARAERELRAAGQSSAPAVPAANPAELLSPQQFEIARLAASGLTNKQIGERLYLSHRTIGTHLYAIFPKLGITSRAGLRDALHDLGTATRVDAADPRS